MSAARPDISADAESVLDPRRGQVKEQKVVNVVLETFPNGGFPCGGSGLPLT